MKLKINKILLLVSVILFGALSACEEDEMGTDEVQLLSFGPAGVKHGDEIVFIGSNLDKIASIVFKPSVEINSNAFTSQSSSQIKLNVPDEAEAGLLMLKTTAGDTLMTKTILNFEVPVVISNFTRKVKPGNNLTITGQKLNWVETVTFADGLTIEQDDFVSQSITELVVEVPMDAQSGFVIFSSGGTEPMTFGTEEQLEVTLPAVTALSPSSIKHTEDLTIEGTDLDLVTEVVLSKDVSILASSFKSQSETEIVVTVPANVVKGTITLKQVSPVDVVTTEELTIILPSATSISPTPATPGVDKVTIVGTDLDLVASLEFPSVGEVDVFESQSATEIVVAVPEGADNGALNYTTIHGYSAGLGVTLIIPGDGPAPLPLVVFDDEFLYNGQNWSWGGTTDFASGDKFYSGSLSAKITYDGTDGGLQIGNLSGIDASSLEVFAFSLFGGEGTDGKSVAVILSGAWGNYNTVTLVEGVWTNYKIDLSSYPDVDLTDINNIIFKMEGTAGGEVMYADRVGFDYAGPEALSYTIYSDGFENSWQDWSWGGASDASFTDEVFDGSTAIKKTYDGSWDGMQFGNGSVDITGYTSFVIYVYGAAASESLQLIVNEEWGQPYAFSAPQGVWTEVTIPVTDVNGGASDVWTNIVVQGQGTAGDVYFDFAGFR